MPIYTRFKGCYIVQNESLIKEDLLICDGQITDPIDLFYLHKKLPDCTIDCEGLVISPGFIDIQVNGLLGFDFSNPEINFKSAYSEIAPHLYQTGVTALGPTIITSELPTYKKILRSFAEFLAEEKPEQSLKITGVHVEGPFLSETKRGMHPEQFIKPIKGESFLNDFEETYGPDRHVIRMLTLAPELAGAPEAIKQLTDIGVTVSIGHTNADFDQVMAAFKAGASFVTHLFNAMAAFHHRSPNMIGSCLEAPAGVHVGLIADGVHVHPAALKLAETVRPGRVVLVTDANAASGLQDGAYTFGSQAIDVKHGQAFVAGTDCLAGTTASLLSCVQNYWRGACNAAQGEFHGLAKALAAASTRPAQALNLDPRRFGNLQPGSAADLVVLRVDPTQKRLHVVSTWIDGACVFSSPA